jgi:hypothetical protein
MWGQVLFPSSDGGEEEKEVDLKILNFYSWNSLYYIESLKSEKNFNFLNFFRNFIHLKGR